jgi:hypothetical protein
VVLGIPGFQGLVSRAPNRNVSFWLTVAVQAGFFRLGRSVADTRAFNSLRRQLARPLDEQVGLLRSGSIISELATATASLRNSAAPASAFCASRRRARARVSRPLASWRRVVLSGRRLWASRKRVRARARVAVTRLCPGHAEDEDAHDGDCGRSGRRCVSSHRRRSFRTDRKRRCVELVAILANVVRPS